MVKAQKGNRIVYTTCCDRDCEPIMAETKSFDVCMCRDALRF